MNNLKDIRETVPCRQCKVAVGNHCRMLTTDGREEVYVDDSYVHKKRIRDYEKKIAVMQYEIIKNWTRLCS